MNKKNLCSAKNGELNSRWPWSCRASATNRSGTAFSRRSDPVAEELVPGQGRLADLDERQRAAPPRLRLLGAREVGSERQEQRRGEEARAWRRSGMTGLELSRAGGLALGRRGLAERRRRIGSGGGPACSASVRFGVNENVLFEEHTGRGRSRSVDDGCSNFLSNSAYRCVLSAWDLVPRRAFRDKLRSEDCGQSFFMKNSSRASAQPEPRAAALVRHLLPGTDHARLRQTTLSPPRCRSSPALLSPRRCGSSPPRCRMPRSCAS